MDATAILKFAHYKRKYMIQKKNFGKITKLKL